MCWLHVILSACSQAREGLEDLYDAELDDSEDEDKQETEMNSDTINSGTSSCEFRFSHLPYWYLVRWIKFKLLNVE